MALLMLLLLLWRGGRIADAAPPAFLSTQRSGAAQNLVQRRDSRERALPSPSSPRPYARRIFASHPAHRSSPRPLRVARARTVPRLYRNTPSEQHRFDGRSHNCSDSLREINEVQGQGDQLYIWMAGEGRTGSESSESFRAFARAPGIFEARWRQKKPAALGPTTTTAATPRLQVAASLRKHTSLPRSTRTRQATPSSRVTTEKHPLRPLRRRCRRRRRRLQVRSFARGAVRPTPTPTPIGPEMPIAASSRWQFEFICLKEEVVRSSSHRPPRPVSSPPDPYTRQRAAQTKKTTARRRPRGDFSDKAIVLAVVRP